MNLWSKVKQKHPQSRGVCVLARQPMAFCSVGWWDGPEIPLWKSSYIITESHLQELPKYPSDVKFIIPPVVIDWPSNSFVKTNLYLYKKWSTTPPPPYNASPTRKITLTKVTTRKESAKKLGKDASVARNLWSGSWHIVLIIRWVNFLGNNSFTKNNSSRMRNASFLVKLKATKVIRLI